MLDPPGTHQEKRIEVTGFNNIYIVNNIFDLEEQLDRRFCMSVTRKMQHPIFCRNRDGERGELCGVVNTEIDTPKGLLFTSNGSPLDRYLKGFGISSV